MKFLISLLALMLLSLPAQATDLPPIDSTLAADNVITILKNEFGITGGEFHLIFNEGKVEVTWAFINPTAKEAAVWYGEGKTFSEALKMAQTSMEVIPLGD